MKFVALISGGKDSMYAIMQAKQQGHTLVCAAHLQPRRLDQADDEEDKTKREEMDSYMYQSAASNVVTCTAAKCLGVPLYTRRIRGTSVNTSLIYSDANTKSTTTTRQNDEVEDLHHLLQSILQTHHPDVEGVSCGAILSTYQRIRLESVCTRLNLTPLCYLWRWHGGQSHLLHSMIHDGNIDAVLVKVAHPLGLRPPKRYLNATLAHLQHRFETLRQEYDFHVCGEGGEYETLTLDCPLYEKYKIVLDDVKVVLDEQEDGLAGFLRIDAFHLQDKVTGEVCQVQQHLQEEELAMEDWNQVVEGVSQGQFAPTENTPSQQEESTTKTTTIRTTITTPKQRQKTQPIVLPHAKLQSGGLWHMSGIMSPTPSSSSPYSTSNKTTSDSESEAARNEALNCFSILQTTLRHHGLTPQDVLSCHLYLSEMSHFQKINQSYKQCFGTWLPPSRSCVAVGKGVLPGGRRVLLDVCAQRGSGVWMRQLAESGGGGDEKASTTATLKSSLCNPHPNKKIQPPPPPPPPPHSSKHPLREVLHVQGLSHWAPICVGPYSQANVLRRGVVFVAGQIGLHPPTMTLVQQQKKKKTKKKEKEEETKNGWEGQLEQCWKNAASVLDGLPGGGGGQLMDCLGGLVYVQSSLCSHCCCDKNKEQAPDEENVAERKVWQDIVKTSRHALGTNGGVTPGLIDGRLKTTKTRNFLWDGYEDEGTMLALQGSKNHDHDENDDDDKDKETQEEEDVPLLMVAVAEMPVGAVCEVELVCASATAVHCLGVQTLRLPPAIFENDICREEEHEEEEHEEGSVMWECGYDPMPTPPTASSSSSFPKQQKQNSVVISTSMRFVKKCFGMIWSTVRMDSNLGDDPCLQLDHVFNKMMQGMMEATEEAGLSWSHALHVRLYYLQKGRQPVGQAFEHDQDGEHETQDNDNNGVEVEAEAEAEADDGMLLRDAWHRELGARCGSTGTSAVATTMVPVLGMEESGVNDEEETKCRGTVVLAAQTLVCNMVHLETELWIHSR